MLATSVEASRDGQPVDLDEVVAEVVAGASVGGLRLNAVRRIPTQTVVSDRERVFVVNVPVNLRQEQPLIAATRDFAGQGC